MRRKRNPSRMRDKRDMRGEENKRRRGCRREGGQDGARNGKQRDKARGREIVHFSS